MNGYSRRKGRKYADNNREGCHGTHAWACTGHATLEQNKYVGAWHCCVSGEVGLTKHQMELLGFLYGNPETNTVSRIASELLISKGSLSLMLTKLEKQGFVEKAAPDGNDDGRKVYISLTENGRKAVENMMEVLLEKGGHVFDVMSQEKRLLFYRKLEELKAIFNLGGWEK